MSRKERIVDYADVLADLEARRAKLDVAIAAIRELTGAPNTAPRRDAAPPRPRKAPTKRGDETEDATVANARRLYEAGKSLQEVADAAGAKYQTVWGWRKRYGWKAPEDAPKAERRKPGRPKIAALYRRCGECSQRTPAKGCCNHCGAKEPAA